MRGKFIRGLIIFLIPLAISFFVIEYCLSGVENMYSLKKKKLDAEADSLKILILGSSQTFYGLDPSVFGMPALNMATIAQQLYYDCNITLNNLDRLRNLKLVILPVDYFTLYYDVDRSSFNRMYYYHYWGIDNPENRPLELGRYSLIATYNQRACIEIISQMLHEKTVHIHYRTGSMHSDGFWQAPPLPDSVGLEAESRARITEWSQRLISMNNYTKCCAMLENLIKELETRNIQVLLISTPVTSNFYEKFDTNLIRKRNEFMGYLVEKYPNAKYSDFTADKRFDWRDFADANHLNSLGAAKFTEIIRKEWESDKVRKAD